MKIELDIWSAGEMAAFGKFMADMALVRAALEAQSPIGVQGGNYVGATLRSSGALTPVGEAALNQTATETTTAAAETVKKTRATKPKAEAKVEIVSESGVTTEESPLVETEAKSDEPPAITGDEVRAAIIDLLNDWSEAKPGDADIRITTLKPILEKLGADKIKNIDPKDFRMALDYVDESRAELAAFKNAEE